MTERRERVVGFRVQEMVTEHSLPLRWMSDLIKVNGLR